MPAWILRLLPFLKPLFDKLSGTSHNCEAEKIRAQKELEEAKAFRCGKIAPRYLRDFILTVLFGFLGLGIIGAIFFPQWFVKPEIDWLKDFFDLGKSLLP